jgi:hypothetical protein
MENMAPVLTMLFAAVRGMLAGAAVVAVTGLGGAFDATSSPPDALLLVLALVLYGMSARDPSTSGLDGRHQLVAIVSALVLDVMVTRLDDRSDRRAQVHRTNGCLGLNLVLLMNLAGAAWLSTDSSDDAALHRLERWRIPTCPSSPFGPPRSLSSSAVFPLTDRIVARRHSGRCRDLGVRDWLWIWVTSPHG